MKKIFYRYQISKYRRFTNGLLFAAIAMIALVLCLVNIFNPTIEKTEIILPFLVAIISLIMGFFSMFRDYRIPER